MHESRNDPDFEIEFLVLASQLLDSQLERLEAEAKGSADPDSFGDFDRIEYVTGLGFVACQQYLTATIATWHAPRSAALQLGPQHLSGVPMVSVVNAAANYWKHSSEWEEPMLPNRSRSTLEALRGCGVDVSGSYLTANALHYLLAPLPNRFGRLLPFLQAWRDHLTRLMSR